MNSISMIFVDRNYQIFILSNVYIIKYLYYREFYIHIYIYIIMNEKKHITVGF